MNPGEAGAYLNVSGPISLLANGPVHLGCGLVRDEIVVPHGLVLVCNYLQSSKITLTDRYFSLVQLYSL